MSQSLAAIIRSFEPPVPYPLPPAKWGPLADWLDLHANLRLLELACGDARLLLHWAQTREIKGTGIDARPDRITAAQTYAREHNLWMQMQFVASEPVDYVQPFHQYDLIFSLEPLRVAPDLASALALMREAGANEGQSRVLIAETFWQQPPPPPVCEALGVRADDLPTLERIDAACLTARYDIVALNVAPPADWDTYMAHQWRSAHQWLAAHADDDHADAVRDWLHTSRRRYLQYERAYVGWGLFVLAGTR